MTRGTTDSILVAGSLPGFLVLSVTGEKKRGRERERESKLLSHTNSLSHRVTDSLVSRTLSMT